MDFANHKPHFNRKYIFNPYQDNCFHSTNYKHLQHIYIKKGALIMPRTEAQKKASAEFNKRKTVQVALRLNIETEKDIIDQLNKVPSKMGYIKELIRKDIENNK